MPGLTTHVDDEYRWAGVEDPKIMITTSRDPSSRLKMFAKVSVAYYHGYGDIIEYSIIIVDLIFELIIIDMMYELTII